MIKFILLKNKSHILNSSILSLYVNVLGLASGIFTIIIITHSYSLSFQAEYYITTSLVSWALLFDFGISQALLYKAKDNNIFKAIEFYLTCYIILGLLFLCAYCIYNNEIRISTTIYYILFLINCSISILLAYTRGLGKEFYYWKLRSFEFTIYTLTLTLTLLYGLSIYSLIISTSLSIIINLIGLSFLIDIKKLRPSLNIKNWVKNLANTQIKVAIEYVSFLIGLKIAIPFIEERLGTEITGKIALTVTLLSIPLSLAIALHTTKISSFLSKRENIKKLYVKWSIMITAFYTLFSVLMLISIKINLATSLNERIATIDIILAIVFGNFISLLLYLTSSWLRIRNKDIGWIYIIAFNFSQLITFIITANIKLSITLSFSLLITILIIYQARRAIIK
ncbi:hypothetical protein [Xenorhabdus bovienii]|uniref:hypothetical protein n=1 Tax=Xenorhabdus bovienii TaxID=40576 RepID=UPI0023B34E8D|nr:hypothetical protein [Xenorhabdus bovienii]MDE9544019.1 hypothetical protein [Xenorhabdus bovienii]